MVDEWLTVKGEDFGVADGGGGRLWWRITSRTTEWLTEDERVGTFAWGLYPIHRDHWWIQMNILVYLVPIALPPSASWHFNRKRIPWIPMIHVEPRWGIQVCIFVHGELHTKSADKPEIYPLHDLPFFGFILPSLTSLDDPHIVAHLAEPNNFSYEFYLPIRWSSFIPVNPVSAPILSNAWLVCLTDTLWSICRMKVWEIETGIEKKRERERLFLVDS